MTYSLSTAFAMIAGLALVHSAASGSATRIDVITRWGGEAAALTAPAGMAPLRAPITSAILHVAMYDAVNAVTARGQAYAIAPTVDRPASAEAAAIEAGYRILLAEIPSQQSALDRVYQELLAAVPDSASRHNGLIAGAEVARQLLAIRAMDGRNAVIPYVPGLAHGAWVPTPPEFLEVSTAFLARVTPFTMDSPSQFRPAGPPPLGSAQWVREYNEVKTLGALTGSTRSDEQTATARFWEPLAGTVWPVSIRRLAGEHALDLDASARFQAAAFAAFADAMIACWDAKFAFNTWRPVTAIRSAPMSGSPHLDLDPKWTPLGVTPNFPEYPSGHACATAAVADTIDRFLPNHMPIAARNVVSGEERVYRTAREVVAEVVEARMLLGVHFRSADEDGAEIGRKIARQIHARWFTRH